MASHCHGGMFDGMPVYTREDARTCIDGGGTVVSDGSGDPCSAESASPVGENRAVQDVAPLGRALAMYGHTDEVRLLDRLNQEAAPVISAIVTRDDELAREVEDGLARLTTLAARATDLSAADPLYTADDHAAFSALAERVAAVGDSHALRQLTRKAIAAAQPYVDLPADAVRERLGPTPDFGDMKSTTTDRRFVAPIEAVSLSQLLGAQNALATAAYETSKLGVLEHRLELEAVATRTIAQKAASLGGLAAGSPGPVRQVAGGWVRNYPGCDIYYSKATGAHEVHGDIRRKYDAVNGPGWLGLPTSDESGTPDGRGRFNHFSRSASIYWTPSTGPMIVRGPIRAFWASQGWEQGPLGYPTADEQRIPGLTPADTPNVAWSAFENDMLFSQGTGCLPAVFASATRQQLLNAIRAMFDKRIKPVDVEVGPVTVTVRPGLKNVDFLHVEDWTYGFWAATPRTVGLRLNGFVSTPGVTDPTFAIDLWLRFITVWPTASFLYPASKTIVATLSRYQIHVDGIGAETIRNSIENNLKEAFAFDPARAEVPDWSIPLGEVPTGANQHGHGDVNFLDVMLMADGALRVYLNPIPPSVGALRRNVAQQLLDSTLEQL